MQGTHHSAAQVPCTRSLCHSRPIRAICITTCSQPGQLLELKPSHHPAVLKPAHRQGTNKQTKGYEATQAHLWQSFYCSAPPKSLKQQVHMQSTNKGKVSSCAGSPV